MSLIETIRNKPEKTRNMIVAGISGFLVLVIILIGLCMKLHIKNNLELSTHSLNRSILKIFSQMHEVKLTNLLSRLTNISHNKIQIYQAKIRFENGIIH